ncbi:hypothetical protein [Vibrio alginolyticus]|uniref:hypothetical protein n=1 Tax=Vibrio alginolyticus TaxID=663 RepID=UPI003754D462
MSIENLFVEDIQDSYLEKGELMSKVSLFFGAGAEIGYGLPSGGKFALDIFRMDVAEDKKRLREAREKSINAQIMPRIGYHKTMRRSPYHHLVELNMKAWLKVV